MILTIITFVIILSLLVFVHEFGHFIVAKKTGIKVLEFAFGFPPRIWSKKVGETTYAINAFPIGGYVKMLGEVEKSSHPRAFENQSRGVRFSVSIAGVVMNLFLAWFILSLGFVIGMSPVVSDYRTIPGKVVKSEIIIAEVQSGSAAESAGLKQMDVLNSADLNGKTIKFGSVEALSDFTKANKGQKILINYSRSGEDLQSELTLSQDAQAPLGIVGVNNAIVRVPWYRAPYVALRETYKITEYTAIFLKDFVAKLVTRGEYSDQVGGPVQIYMATGTVVKIGIMAVLQFVAILSINLAIINILPLPALDGGRIFFILSEAIARRRLIKEHVENIIHSIGFALLILLIALVTYKDIAKLISK